MATKTALTTHPDPAPSRRSGFLLGSRLRLSMAFGLIVLLLLLGGAYVLAQQRQDQAARVAPAVQVAGLPVAGLKPADAQAAIAARFAGIADQQVVLRKDGRIWTFTARDLGITLDAAATAQAAAQAGRDAKDPAVGLVFTRDRATADAALRVIAADVAVPAQDATLTADADGVRVVPAQPGHRLDPDATWNALVAATSQASFGDVAVQVQDVAPQVLDKDIAPALATVHRLSDKPVVLNGHDLGGTPRSWTIDPGTLRTWLQITAAGTGPVAVQNQLDDAGITSYLQGLAADVKHPAQNATLSLPNYVTTTVLTADAPGQQLNVAATLARIQAAALADGKGRTVDLVIDPVLPTVTAAALQPLKDRLDRQMHEGLALTYGDKIYQLSGSQVALVLYVQPVPGAAVPYQVNVSDADAAHLATLVAQATDQLAQDAVYRLVDNKISLVKTPQDGVKVDRVQTAAAIKDALLTGKSSVPMVATTLKPTFAATDQANNIVTPNLLQSDSTFYGGSSPERNWNVTLGASKLDGWLVAPGAVFSLNDALGDLTLAAGYKMGWAILVQAGNVSTIPAEAGGICQVATTLFHPVFWAGLPMVEHHHHSYWISLYGVAPMGRQGLDATISPPDWDFKFRNTTGNWLLIRAHGDHQNVKVELWGTNPGWRVQVDGPVITQIVHTDPRPVRELSDKLAAGREVQVEHAQDGFTSDIHRQVFAKDGTKIDDWHAQGTYLPSHNTFVIGTGTTVPDTATPPTPTP